MNIEEIRDFSLSFKGVTEEMPFGPETVVFKVMGKMFLLLPLDVEDVRISIKNSPERNIELRGEHPNIMGAFHMNKTHWNNVIIDFSTKRDFVKLLITESYDLVVKGLTKKLQIELSSM
ncbi:MmcQ/YjbR family DNA-binding protein [Lacihabitans soyangensis]|uniref:MmcQ/YjbR family DNA-binding protein n=1 Tax=Lacihabitans soyangensis TaxID=869394 RepID=A0AAE3H6Y4_9BACT|nr:MmcQ/YjbR family DNA-binding protein [Lacihabitans soyangensis]MCP9765275.1 MmcQ/YjbR family DNA-binding protein [Lacihabitans soyangensis]